MLIEGLDFFEVVVVGWWMVADVCCTCHSLKNRAAIIRCPPSPWTLTVEWLRCWLVGHGIGCYELSFVILGWQISEWLIISVSRTYLGSDWISVQPPAKLLYNLCRWCDENIRFISVESRICDLKYSEDLPYTVLILGTVAGRISPLKSLRVLDT